MKVVWTTYTMPERPRPLGRNSAGTQLYGPAGAAIWNAPTLDPELGRVYTTVGTCYISEFFDERVGYDGGTCVSVMAFDMETGKKAWWTQLVPMDRHPGGCGREPEEQRLNCPGYVDDPDDDPSGAPVLYTAENGQRIIIQGQESGRITALDPDNDGAVLWVAQAGDEMAAMNGGFGGAFDGRYYYKPLPFEDGTGAIAAIRPQDGSRAWYQSLDKPEGCDSEDAECSSANWSSASAVPGAVIDRFLGRRAACLRGRFRRNSLGIPDETAVRGRQRCTGIRRRHRWRCANDRRRHDVRRLGLRHSRRLAGKCTARICTGLAID